MYIFGNAFASIESIEVVAVLAFMAAIVATIVIYGSIMPERRYKSLSSFGKWLADIFNFRSLLIESILKFFYVLSTVMVVIFGVLAFVFALGENAQAAVRILVATIFMPILIRLVYEGLMMMVILVRNVMEINNRLKKQELDKAAPEIPVVPPVVNTYIPTPVPAPEPVMANAPNFQTQSSQQQTQIPEKRFCPNCGTQITDSSLVTCPNCRAGLI